MKNFATMAILLLVSTTAMGQKLIEQEDDIKNLKDIKVSSHPLKITMKYLGLP